jgi:hypothetical protein
VLQEKLWQVGGTNADEKDLLKIFRHENRSRHIYNPYTLQTVESGLYKVKAYPDLRGAVLVRHFVPKSCKVLLDMRPQLSVGSLPQK